MTAELRLAPRKSPSQRRSAVTYEAILEAAARVLEGAGLAGFNTNAVAARAGISVGSLYQYFPHKNALAAELSRRRAAVLLAALDAAVEAGEGGALEADVARLARAAIAWQSERPALERALDQLEESLDLDSGSRGTAGQIRALIMRLLAPHLPEASGPALEAAAADSLVMARALIDHASARGDVNSPGFEARLTGAICGYLAAAGAKRAP